jgi:hypothetical protein
VSATSEPATGGGPISQGDGRDELVWQEARQTVARRLNVAVEVVKPCYARIPGVPEGSRNSTAYILATELRRMGVETAAAWTDLLRWNRTCKPPLPERELQTTFQSAWHTEKTYGCRGLLASVWCVGRELCHWRRGLGRRTCRESDFFDFGWPALLKSADFRVYCALVRLEQLRGVGAGGLVIAGTREYASLGGLCRTRVYAALERLEGKGLLLVVEKGEKRQAGLPARACQVKRVVPVPEPPVAPVNRRLAALRGTRLTD